jgi:pantothenate kinase
VRATLEQLVDRAAVMARPGTRRVLGITGAPGAGKSTLCAALLDALGDQAALVGMDGFHYANAELQRLGRADRKGAPDTFDVDGYVALLTRLRAPSATPVYGPVFDRALEEPIGSAVPVFPGTPLVITEGNYLLLAEHGWEEVRDRLDEVWYLDVPPEVREQRLLRRRLSFGHEPRAAEDWVRTVDGRNGRTVEASRPRADLVVHLDVPQT